MRQLEQSITSDVTETNPFILYRDRLDSYDKAIAAGWSDQQFVDLVSRLDEKIQDIDGTGFSITPVVDGSQLAAALNLELALRVKVEINSVGGSHKARHLFGVALHLAIDNTTEDSARKPLAIASCGNAAIAASIIAKAINHPIEVFVPTWADKPSMDLLQELGAEIQMCETNSTQKGDPCYSHFKDAVANGSHPFGVQGTDTPGAFDGGRTLGWELRDQVPHLDAVFVQVGGGALGTATAQALPDVAIYPIQTEGCAPLKRAWDLLAPDFDISKAVAEPENFMWPWAQPTSAASGLLDDITYDWIPLSQATLASGGHPIVVSEETLIETHRVATSVTGLNVSYTGVAGLAGLVEAPPEHDAVVGVLFTGIDREIDMAI